MTTNKPEPYLVMTQEGRSLELYLNELKLYFDEWDINDVQAILMRSFMQERGGYEREYGERAARLIGGQDPMTPEGWTYLVACALASLELEEES